MKFFLSFLTAMFIMAAANLSMADQSCPLKEKGGMANPKMMHGTKHDCPMGSGGHSKTKKGCPLGRLIAVTTQNEYQLGLTDDQVRGLNGLKLECQKVKILGKAQVRVAYLDLGHMMAPEGFDLEAVKAQIKKKMALKEEMKIREIELYSKALSLLTPEQLVKVGHLLATSGGPCETGSKSNQSKDGSTKPCPKK